MSYVSLKKLLTSIKPLNFLYDATYQERNFMNLYCGMVGASRFVLVVTYNIKFSMFFLYDMLVQCVSYIYI